MQLAAYKANARQDMYNLVMASQCITQQRVSLDYASKGRMSLWKCIVWSEQKSATVEYYVQDQYQ